MNDKIFNELVGQCLECINAWKKENWHQPLDIQWGDYVNHCYQYGGEVIRNLYDEYFTDEENQQMELNRLERLLLIQNLGTEQGERIYIGRRIAELRAQHGMTQQELADKTGIKREHVSRIEAGRYSVGLDILAKVAKALGTNIDFC